MSLRTRSRGRYLPDCFGEYPYTHGGISDINPAKSTGVIDGLIDENGVGSCEFEFLSARPHLLRTKGNENGGPANTNARKWLSYSIPVFLALRLERFMIFNDQMKFVVLLSGDGSEFFAKSDGLSNS